jgi:hypothetical protein
LVCVRMQGHGLSCDPVLWEIPPMKLIIS